jgi:hypothetical protein
MLSTETTSLTTPRWPLPNLQRLAEVYAAAGLSLIPLKPGRANDPWIRDWHTYLQRQPYSGDLARWFAEGVKAIALVGGAVSGGLAWLDFEDEAWFDTWRLALPPEAAELAACLPLVRSARGSRQLFYRCPASSRRVRLTEKREPPGFVPLWRLWRFWRTGPGFRKPRFLLCADPYGAGGRKIRSKL